MEHKKPLLTPLKTLTFSFFRVILILFSISVLLYFIISLNLVWTSTEFRHLLRSSSRVSDPLLARNIVFGIASSKKEWSRHKDYVKIWWKSDEMKGCIFVDSLLSEQDEHVPDICVSQDTSHFRYTYKHGYPWYIRIARIVSETVKLNHKSAKWYVFGDGDTVFFTENLVKILSKHDHELWYYIGANSEIYERNRDDSFDMGFWSAGFALSAPLAKVFAKVFDSCLEHYPHLYGSDGRIYSCLAELGVGFTREPGFHQVDVRGNIYGILAAHPLTPLLSLAHLTEVDPIFPNMTALTAMEHLYKAAKLDPERILQQTVCYDRWFQWTISISWGYAVEIFNINMNLPQVLRVRESFKSSRKAEEPNYTFSTRSGQDQDACAGTTLFYFDNGRASSTGNRIKTEYRRVLADNCTFDPMASPRKLQEIVVFSHKSNLDFNQLRAPRRQCCEVLPSTSGSKLELSIRECGVDELIRMPS